MAKYSYSRDFTGLVIKHLLYPLWALKNRSRRLRYASKFEASQYWPAERLKEHQWTLFVALVTHAYETCPYYRTKYEEAGFSPADLRQPNDFLKVPTITKEEIQEHKDEMISSKFIKNELIKDMTGGSTGSPMEFYYNEDRLDSRVAATIRHNLWAGLDVGDRVAVLWGAPRDINTSGRLKDKIRDWILDRRIILDASSMDEAAMLDFSQKLIRYKPKVLLAYANTLGLYARFVQKENIKGITPKGIMCSAEVLTDENRKLIEEVFGCPIYNRYGSREFAVIASECGKHDGMHVNAENLLVEVLVDGVPFFDRDGEIVITDLKNLAMPMIRYHTRDVGQIKKDLCACGRGLPLLDLKGGRVTDFLIATSGKKVSGIVMATYVITDIPGIRQIQFIQNEHQSVSINLVKAPEWSEQTTTELITKTKEYLGDDMNVEIVFQYEIPFEKSGKYRFSISSIQA